MGFGLFIEGGPGGKGFRCFFAFSFCAVGCLCCFFQYKETICIVKIRNWAAGRFGVFVLCLLCLVDSGMGRSGIVACAVGDKLFQSVRELLVGRR